MLLVLLDNGLIISPGTFDGGVRRLLTPPGCEPTLMVEIEGYFPERGGGGSVNSGSCAAAGFRAVKLD